MVAEESVTPDSQQQQQQMKIVLIKKVVLNNLVLVTVFIVGTVWVRQVSMATWCL